jgi:HAMP domain-containing protein
MGMASLRQKSLIILLAMFMALGGIFLFSGYTLIRSIVLKEANDYVESALRVAWSEYDHRLTELQLILQLVASRTLLIDAMKQGDDTTITARLDALMQQHHLDFMTVLYRDGRVFTRAREPHRRGDTAHMDGILRDALAGKEVSGTVLIPPQILELEGAGLLAKARLDTVPTPMSKGASSEHMSSGMALKAAVPVWDGSRQIGVVYGGVLLNHNDALVDKIQQTLFLDHTYDGRPLGSVTVFQGDARIATTLRNADGSRAVGTTVSSEVYDRVVEKGEPWLGKAFVVDDWYLAAYEPIYDPLQHIIGLLYVGVLDKKFSDYQKSLVGQFALTGLAGTVVALILSYLLLSRFVGPIKRLARAVEQVSEGRFPAGIPEERQFREMYHLTRAFNAMVQQIQERNNRLGQMNVELSGMNQDLQRQNKNYMELLGFVVHENAHQFHHLRAVRHDGPIHRPAQRKATPAGGRHHAQCRLPERHDPELSGPVAHRERRAQHQSEPGVAEGGCDRPHPVPTGTAIDGRAHDGFRSGPRRSRGRSGSQPVAGGDEQPSGQRRQIRGHRQPDPSPIRGFGRMDPGGRAEHRAGGSGSQRRGAVQQVHGLRLQGPGRKKGNRAGALYHPQNY